MGIDSERFSRLFGSHSHRIMVGVETGSCVCLIPELLPLVMLFKKNKQAPGCGLHGWAAGWELVWQGRLRQKQPTHWGTGMRARPGEEGSGQEMTGGQLCRKGKWHLWLLREFQKTKERGVEDEATGGIEALKQMSTEQLKSRGQTEVRGQGQMEGRVRSSGKEVSVVLGRKGHRNQKVKVLESRERRYPWRRSLY